MQKNISIEHLINADETEERRKLRRQQRELHEQIVFKRENNAEISLEIYERLRNDNNRLFGKIVHSREQLLDAENLKVPQTIYIFNYITNFTTCDKNIKLTI